VLTNATVGVGIIMVATNGLLELGNANGADASGASLLVPPYRGHAEVTDDPCRLLALCFGLACRRSLIVSGSRTSFSPTNVTSTPQSAV
jgi:hypothetical protein